MKGLQEILGSTGAQMARSFEMMGVVEDVLEERGLSKARLSSGSSLFAMMCPTEVMEELRDLDIFREHVVELCERFEACTELKTGTKVEVAIAMLQAALRTPLNRDGLATLYVATRGSKLAEFADRWEAMERHEGHAQDLFEEVAKKLSCKDRA